jgi:hypothetical protein
MRQSCHSRGQISRYKIELGIQRYLVLVRIVTNSSAAVGWIPIVVSNCVLVAPQLIATAKP